MKLQLNRRKTDNDPLDLSHEADRRSNGLSARLYHKLLLFDVRVALRGSASSFQPTRDGVIHLSDFVASEMRSYDEHLIRTKGRP